MSEIQIEKLFPRREKTKNKSKIRQMYDSKLKSDVIGREIRMKTHNLTRIHAQNDSIDHRIKGSSFHDSKDEIQHSRGDFFLFSQ